MFLHFSATSFLRQSEILHLATAMQTRGRNLPSSANLSIVVETAGGTDVAIPSVPINYPDSQFWEPDQVANTGETAVPAATATQKKSTKKGKDGKWTDKMKDKLAAVIFTNKAYIKTEKKWRTNGNK